MLAGRTEGRAASSLQNPTDLHRFSSFQLFNCFILFNFSASDQTAPRPLACHVTNDISPRLRDSAPQSTVLASKMAANQQSSLDRAPYKLVPCVAADALKSGSGRVSSKTRGVARHQRWNAGALPRALRPLSGKASTSAERVTYR